MKTPPPMNALEIREMIFKVIKLRIAQTAMPDGKQFIYKPLKNRTYESSQNQNTIPGR